jgi:hypothetical protein
VRLSEIRSYPPLETAVYSRSQCWQQASAEHGGRMIHPLIATLHAVLMWLFEPFRDHIGG